MFSAAVLIGDTVNESNKRYKLNITLKIPNRQGRLTSWLFTKCDLGFETREYDDIWWSERGLEYGNSCRFQVCASGSGQKTDPSPWTTPMDYSKMDFP